MKKVLAILALGACAVFGQVTGVVNPQGPYPDGTSHPVIQNVISLQNQSATITTQNILCVPTNFNGAANQNIATTIGAPVGQTCPAGVYRVTAYMNTTSGTNGGGTATLTFGYTSGASAKSGISVITALTESTNGESPASGANSSRTFRSDGSANITYGVVQGSSGNYDLYIVLERLY